MDRIKRKNHRFLPLLFVFLTFNAVLADSVFMKNGDRITGSIWSESRDEILIVAHQSRYEIPKKHVLRAEYSPGNLFRIYFENGKTLLLSPFHSDARQLSFKDGSLLIKHDWTKVRKAVRMP